MPAVELEDKVTKKQRWQNEDLIDKQECKNGRTKRNGDMKKKFTEGQDKKWTDEQNKKIDRIKVKGDKWKLKKKRKLDKQRKRKNDILTRGNGWLAATIKTRKAQKTR